MYLINCEVELNLRWTTHCILSVYGTENANGKMMMIILVLL